MGSSEMTGSKYRIKVTYTKPVAPAANNTLNIMSIFEPTGSYVDSAAYVGAASDKVWSDKVVGDTDITSNRDAGATSTRSIYATNYHMGDFGIIEAPEFFKDTHIPFPLPLAQFIYDSIADADMGVPGTTDYIEFVVNTFEEAAFYAQLNKDMKEQGFTFQITPLDITEG